MTDRELLERAAKAAGIAEKYIDCANCGVYNREWNPLEDDGDALCLAVKLGIAFKYDCNAPPELNLPMECAIAVNPKGGWSAESGRDKFSATRRAIVRAAAAMSEDV